MKKTGNIETEANELRRGNKIRVPTSVCVRNHEQNLPQNHGQNHVQNHVQTMFKIMIKTMFNTIFEKNKNVANEDMSFLKITDPKKRDFIVNEFLKTRQNIQQNFLSDCVGD